MEYNENIFKESANKKAKIIWLVFAILLSANYGSDTQLGIHTPQYFITFLALCWLPCLLSQIKLKKK